IDMNNLGSSVILTGRQSDMPMVYSALDFLVLSSRGEAFPNVICEGMLCGLPCISTDVGDCRTIIGDTGFVVPPGSASALGAAVLKAAALSEEERYFRGFQARKRIIGNYSLDTYLAKHIGLYYQMTDAEVPTDALT